MVIMMRHQGRSAHRREALHAAGMPLDWNVLIVVLLKGCWASAREVS